MDFHHRVSCTIPHSSLSSIFAVIYYASYLAAVRFQRLQPWMATIYEEGCRDGRRVTATWVCAIGGRDCRLWSERTPTISRQWLNSLIIASRSLATKIGGTIGVVCHRSEASLEDGDLSGDILGVIVDSVSQISAVRTISWGGKKFRCGIQEVHQDWRPDFLDSSPADRSPVASPADSPVCSPAASVEDSDVSASSHGEVEYGKVVDVGLHGVNEELEEGVFPRSPLAAEDLMMERDDSDGGTPLEVEEKVISCPVVTECVNGPRLEKRARPNSLSPSVLADLDMGFKAFRGTNICGVWRPYKQRPPGDPSVGESVGNVSPSSSIVPDTSLSENSGENGDESEEVDNTISVGARVGVDLANFVHQVRNLWDNSAFLFQGVESQGRSGGLLSIWNPSVFRLEKVIKNPNFLFTGGSLPGDHGRLNIINVYAPQGTRARKLLWDKLIDLMDNENGLWMVVGDFNDVRCPEDRLHSSFNQSSADAFNRFISHAGLCEYQMGGSKFTYSYGNGKNFSKLDRVLVCADYFHKWPGARLTALPRLWSDHCPLILKSNLLDFGPTPFKFFSSWLKDVELVSKIKLELCKRNEGSYPPDVHLRNKLRRVKEVSKEWACRRKESVNKERDDLVDFCHQMDRDSEQRVIDGIELEDWVNKKGKLSDIEKKRIDDLRQKARIKWAMEGDDNTAFFHGIINSNRANGRINGLRIRNHWVEDPDRIKHETWRYFKELFSDSRKDKPSLDCGGISSISSEQGEWLVRPFSMEEIKSAVWDCDGDKAPGPDGFNLNFLKFFWDDIGDDFLQILNRFHDIGRISPGCGASFLHLIPKSSDAQSLGEYRPISLLGCISKVVSKVLACRLKPVLPSIISETQLAFVEGRHIVDGPLILNETVAWLKHSKRKGLLFKIDFRKAFDSLDWGFIDSVLHHMGFPVKWRSWVFGILSSARASVLVNGSPTREFNCSRGVRQGDPLSPYLFVIAMEALDWMVNKACLSGIYHGICLPSNGPVLSHIFFADDVIMMGEWSESNARNIVRLLRVFFLVSGLEINLKKCAIMGVNVDPLEVKSMAEILNCADGSIPFDYLGMVVGANMNRIASWKSVVDTFERRLSRWKAKVLSFGGRLTLVKSVLDSLPTYFFSVYKAPKGVINQLEKIRFRFLWGGNCDANKIHWVNRNEVCKPKRYGGLGLVKLEDFNLSLLAKWLWRLKAEEGSLWGRVVSAVHVVRNRREDFPCKVSIPGIWKNIVSVKKELRSKNVIWEQFMKYENGVWRWISEEGFPFSSAEVRRIIFKNEGGDRVLSKFIWSKLVPAKINAFMWRLVRNRIATISELQRRGLNGLTNLCRLCNEGEDSAAHIFTGCSCSSLVWQWVWGWVAIPPLLLFSLEDLVDLHKDRLVDIPKREIFLAIEYITCWSLWLARNDAIFQNRAPCISKIICNIRSWSSLWCDNRCRKVIDWRNFIMV
ncbi:hypothetical protein SSX86_032219 [Deinandra increscens subsp. villosa]|uniref:Reverse transcriptase domain-containing protein n=1 Tax=Deinandra increscens subsp. villosa TaxID=3103831 RepID=A0AAP0C378_9ASTR